MKCPMKHQQAYALPDGLMGELWCPSCRQHLSRDESLNVVLRLLRRAANIETSAEQHRLEKEPPA